MYQEYSTLAADARFVIVPGPNDPSVIGDGVLPKGRLPNYFAKGLVDKVANIHMATNPCRLRFYTQEIVIYREDILRKMQVRLRVLGEWACADTTQ